MNINYIKLIKYLTCILVLLSQSCEEINDKNAHDPDYIAPSKIETHPLPLRIWPLRYKGTICIDINAKSNHGSNRIYLVEHNRSDGQWQIFTQFPHSQEKDIRPISKDLAIIEVKKIFRILEDHYSVEINQLRIDLLKINNLTEEQMIEYTENPILSDKLQAKFIIEILDEYMADIQ
jgi:hypothetical protein